MRNTFIKIGSYPSCYFNIYACIYIYTYICIFNVAERKVSTMKQKSMQNPFLTA